MNHRARSEGRAMREMAFEVAMSGKRRSCTGAGLRCRSPCSRRRRLSPRTASMPRSRLRLASLRVSFVERLSMSKPSSPAPTATLRFRRLWRSSFLTRNAAPAAAPDEVSADEIVVAADRRRVEREVDPVPARADDVVAGDEVAVSLLDRDAVPALRDAISGDHVSAAGGNDDGGTVSSEAVASHPIAIGFLERDCGGIA